jgi:hypothetical protein
MDDVAAHISYLLITKKIPAVGYSMCQNYFILIIEKGRVSLWVVEVGSWTSLLPDLGPFVSRLPQPLGTLCNTTIQRLLIPLNDCKECRSMFLFSAIFRRQLAFSLHLLFNVLLRHTRTMRNHVIQAMCCDRLLPLYPKKETGDKINCKTHICSIYSNRLKER